MNTTHAASNAATQPAPAAVWPFPANGQPIPWTPAQIAAHTAQQRAQLGEALLDAAHDLRTHPTPNEENE